MTPQPLPRRHAAALIAFALLMPTPVLADRTAAEAAYTRIAHWLFERYLDQAIAITRHNAGQKISGADEAIAKEAPALKRFLGRHRDGVVAELLRPLREIVPESEAGAVAGKVTATPPAIDPQTLKLLRDVDLDFRRNSQRVLRAMTFELDLLVEQVLESLLQPKN